ncbi:MAG: CarD family transcriptional regulator, partial [Polyangiales bacterium]
GRSASANRSGSKAKSGGTTKKKASSRSSSNGRNKTTKKKASSSSSASRKSTTKKKTATKAKAGSKTTARSKAKSKGTAKAPAKKAKAPAAKAKAPAKKAKAPAKKAKAPAKKAKTPAKKAKAPATKAKAPATKAKSAAPKPKPQAKAPEPKAAAKPSPSAGSFDVGDKAVHPAHGVGEITSIESRDIAGTRKAFYILKILDTGMTVMVPTDGAERLGLRKVISRDDAKKVLAILQKNEIAVTSQPWNRRYREYMDMLKSGSPYEVAKVLRDLYRLKGDKELSFGERRLLEQARTLLVTELALARRCKEQTVEDEIEGILSA